MQIMELTMPVAWHNPQSESTAARESEQAGKLIRTRSALHFMHCTISKVLCDL